MQVRLFTVLLVILMLPAVSSAGQLVFDGAFVQGGLVQGRTEPQAVVEFDGQRVRVSEEGHFLLGFGRDAPPEAKVEVRFKDGQVQERVFEVAKREYQIQRIDGLPKRKVTPTKKEDLARIRKDAEQAREARKLDAVRTDFLSGFIWPTRGRISGVYGSQRILNGTPRSPHYGVDIAAPTGSSVRAPADGVVTLVHPDMFYSGATLILDHGHGLSSTFLHLNRILVEEGQRVRQGDLIAEVGASGRVTGAHLDWRMNLFTTRLDPQLLVGPMTKE
jgi:murein DD-endopeptidase MepM/ murein hydrolase activator NlpD